MMHKKIRQGIKDKSVLVTGGAGFIGSHLVDALLAEENKVIIIDNLFSGSEININDATSKGAIFYKDDAESFSILKHIIETHSIEVVFNLATKPLNYSFENPSNALDTNIKVALNLLELQRDNKFETLCHFSSSEVYGTAQTERMDENHPRKPTTTYAAGKAAADLAISSYVEMFNLDAFILRPFNNFGPRQNYKGKLAAIIPLTVSRIINGINPEIHGTGEQMRDFIYVKDTISSTLKLYEIIPKGEDVNIATDNSITMNYLMSNIVKIMKYDGSILKQPERGADVVRHTGCNKKMNSLLDFNPTSFDDALLETIDWYIKEISSYKKT